MGFSKTGFKYFNKYCIGKFGPEMGNQIFMAAEEKLAEMINEADYRNNKYIRWHMDTNMLPTIAMYLVLKKFDVTADKAYDVTSEVLQIACRKIQRKNQFIGRLPLGYYLFKIFCKSIIAKQYPKEGWDIQWIKYDENEIHFDMKSCIYLEITQKYNCPEICPLFCANDDITLAGYKPAIVFERTETIGRGQNICDFHFKNKKSIN